ncbi:MAG TPA: EamA family transporter, partial [Candidatus Caenarcaniphilales bacterium]|nr:EamA family transporter [Candidatus Caenarcaniphilales bacterium]
LPLVIVAGLGFAGFFLFLDAAGAAGAGIWWSLVVVRLVGVALVLSVLWWAIARLQGRSLSWRTGIVLGVPRLRSLSISLLPVLLLFGLTGAGDLGGNAFFVLANQHDSLPVAVVLSSLYPVVTTILAAFVLRERLRPLQLAGIALTVVGVALIGAGDELGRPG